MLVATIMPGPNQNHVVSNVGYPIPVAHATVQNIIYVVKLRTRPKFQKKNPVSITTFVEQALKPPLLQAILCRPKMPSYSAYKT